MFQYIRIPSLVRVAALLFAAAMTHVRADDRPVVYLLSGLGADERSFDRLELPEYETVVLPDLLPERGESMQDYARRMSRLVDPSRPAVFVGVSFGGMVAVEMAQIIPAEKVIIISSAKTRRELPARYRMLRWLPIHRLVGHRFQQVGARIVRPLFEPASRGYGDFFQQMVDDKHPRYIRRATHCIATWSRKESPDSVYHIHGTADRTLPIDNIADPIVVQDGSHMMVYIRGDEISAIINTILADRR
ncbi:MAG: alpha/beta hydrolase [Spirochaetales bacterium]|nr:alpha/beta hydrolase [Spirochaetales bacterium]